LAHGVSAAQKKSGRFRGWRACNPEKPGFYLDAIRVLALERAWETGVTFAEVARL
jgi:hypothetical protein